MERRFGARLSYIKAVSPEAALALFVAKHFGVAFVSKLLENGFVLGGRGGWFHIFSFTFRRSAVADGLWKQAYHFQVVGRLRPTMWAG